MKKYNDNMYYYVYQDIIKPTSDEVKEEVYCNGGDMEDCLYSMEEVRGDELNKREDGC